MEEDRDASSFYWLPRDDILEMAEAGAKRVINRLRHAAKRRAVPSFTAPLELRRMMFMPWRTFKQPRGLGLGFEGDQPAAEVLCVAPA
eukprot:3736982-Pyramimonas_sp.AAC.1